MQLGNDTGTVFRIGKWLCTTCLSLCRNGWGWQEGLIDSLCLLLTKPTHKCIDCLKNLLLSKLTILFSDKILKFPSNLGSLFPDQWPTFLHWRLILEGLGRADTDLFLSGQLHCHHLWDTSHPLVRFYSSWSHYQTQLHLIGFSGIDQQRHPPPMSRLYPCYYEHNNPLWGW